MGRNCSFGAVFACLLITGGPVASASDNLTKHHALSLIGTPKHELDYTHFSWVNPNAPLISAKGSCAKTIVPARTVRILPTN